MALLRQALAINKKNFIVMRSPKKCFGSFFVISMPMVYSLFILLFSATLEETNRPAVQIFNASTPTAPSCAAGERIAYVPDTANAERVVRNALAHANLTCDLLAFESYAALRLALLAEQQALRFRTPAAFLLELGERASTYTMLLRSLDELGSFDASEAGLVKYSRDVGGADGAESAWLKNGGVAFALAFDQALAEWHLPGAQLNTSELSAAKLPLPAYSSNFAPNTGYLLYVIPFYITYGISSIGFNAIEPIVVEREKRLLEGMQMMGLSSSANTAGWYLTFAICQVLGPVVTTIIVAISGFLDNSEVSFVFITLLLHTLSTVAFCFMLVPLIRSSKQSSLYFLVFMLAPGVGLYMANVATDFTPAFFWPSCLVSVAAAPLGIGLMLDAEMNGDGLKSAVDTSNGTPLVGVWLFQILDTLLYAFMAWYLDQVIPAITISGGRRSWDFCLPRCSRHRRSIGTTGTPPPDETAACVGGSGVGAGAAVRAHRLSKTFGSDPPVHALNDLTFEMANGEVTGLLGQNGAGKTTAINILCGLVRPTSGYARVRGHDVRTHIGAIRSFSGVCAQHDTLLDDLTLAQHVELYAGVKSVDKRRAREQVEGWLQQLGMSEKLNTRADTLSGGQRRKLSLILALLGEPKFVLLDEPTAGMDPHSRRAVWEFVLSSKAERATLLTTHFMDEADVLCSSLVVVSNGSLAASGSPSELKAKYASGYHLVAALSPAVGEPAHTQAAAARLLALAQSYAPEATLEHASAEEARLTLPSSASAAFGALFADLDAQTAQLGVSSYGLSLPSLQEAFIKILDEQKGAGGFADAKAAAQTPLLHSAGGRVESAAATHPKVGAGAQVRIVMHKLWMEAAAEPKQSVLSLLVLTAGVVLAFILGILFNSGSPSAAKTDLPQAVSLSPGPFSDVRAGGYPLPYLPPSGAVQTQLGTSQRELYAYTPDPSHAEVACDTPSGPHHALSANMSTDAGAFAAFALACASSPPSMAQSPTVLYNSSYPHSLPAYVALLDAAALAALAPDLSVSARVGELPKLTDASSAASETTLTLQIAPLVMLFVMLIVTLATAKRLAAERYAHTKQVLLLSGLDVRIFWAGYFVWDGIHLLLLIVGVGTVAAGASGAVVAEALPALVAGELLAIPGVILMAYLISLPFKNGEEATAFLVATFMLPGLLPTLLTTFLTDETVKLVFQCILLVIPPNQIVSVIISVLNVQLNSIYAQDAGADAYGVSEYFRLSYTAYTYDYSSRTVNEGVGVGAGSAMIAATVTSSTLALLLYALELRKYTARAAASTHSDGLRVTDVDADAVDADVKAERARVAAMRPDDAAAVVRMVGLRKDFYPRRCGGQKAVTAVDGLTLAIPNGTCFALLGPNGAGKTTAINLLTGELKPSAGDASIGGVSIHARLSDVFQNTGFCPQLKGLWESLTLRQHLSLVLRLKGHTGTALTAAIAKVEEEYGLREHAHKKAKLLSGGTRRKLSAAMALSCGNPSVVFVDEPTTGVDVGTRRFIWERIREAAKRRVVVLTTHYMDEADALAQRIGIMSGGRLRVLGSPQHLKTVHGGGYRVELKAEAEAEAALTALVMAHFTNVKRADSQRGTLVFDVGKGFSLSAVFAAFEEAKMTLGLQTFTMSQTTLEDVFLRVAAADTKRSKRTRLQVQAAATAAAATTPNVIDREGSGEGSGVPTPTAAAQPAETEEVWVGLVRDGYYINGWLNNYIRIKRVHASEPPAYDYQQVCFAFYWVLPIPCICCAPSQRMVLQPADAEAAEEAEVYESERVECGGKARHVWSAEARFEVRGTCSEKYKHIRD